MAKIRVGVIADIHGDIETAIRSVKVLGTQELDMIVINGDLNDRAHTPGSIAATQCCMSNK